MKKILLTAVAICCASVSFAQAPRTQGPTPEQKAINTTSTTDLQDWMRYLTSEECRGRLTGDIGYDRAAQFVADQFKAWGLEPGGDKGTYFQDFEHPYTIVTSTEGYFHLHMPMGSDWVTKEYDYPDNYMVGGTSDTGLIEQSEMIYVGYGITAPELGYDSYKGLDVKGKVVVCERDVPYTGQDEDKQRAWMPYQYHSNKMTNAYEHGAAGLVYISTSGNPNPGFNKGFIYCCVGEAAVKDMFAGTGKTHEAVVEQMKKTLKPISFKLNTKCDIKAFGEFHPEGVGHNVVGILRGSDPTLAPEYLTLGGHLDHIGFQPYLCEGATDNASGSVIVMGAAKNLATSGFKPKRTIIFSLFGGEETGLIGSKWMADHPVMPNENCKALINIDCLSVGYGFSASVASKNNSLWEYMENAAAKVDRPFMRRQGRDKIVTRPRTDEANFFLKGVPTVAPSAYGSTVRPPYHIPGDTMDYVNFDLVRDAVKWMTYALMDLSTDSNLKIYKKF
ncbi:MAG: M20/M25/M40 family metallo-hydrolase [Bacteroidales bacterium]|nr:M20/M25/M40 family metallo-hydrolase [Bacteroidales bacterium]